MRVVIADDQALVRGGFRLILTAAGMEVVAEAADGAQAVTAVLEHRPDVALMDIRMPELDGLEATRRILAADRGTRVLVLTTFDLDEYIYEALTAGERSASPSAITWIAATSCSGGVSLSRKPLAPARSASYTYSSRSNVVRMTTRTSRPV